MTLQDRPARYRERILASITVDATGCWLWQKTKAHNGYGTFAFGGGKNARAHRVSFQCFKGEIPKGLDVCHTCDVRACVNPEHLFVGTRSENILDASAKNRVNRTVRVRGSAHHSAKLSDEKVARILSLLQERSRASIAREFGVSHRLVTLIHRGEIWRHVPRGGAA